MNLTIVPLPLPKQSEYPNGEPLIECYLSSTKRFKDLPEEWWHYTCKKEPFPENYFDFDVK